MPYRTPTSPPAPVVSLAVTLAWRGDPIAVRHVFDHGEAAAGDVAGSIGPIPCEGIGVLGFTFATLAAGVATGVVPAGATAALHRLGGPVTMVEGPATIELAAGDACEIAVGDFTLHAAADAREAAPSLRARPRPVWLLHLPLAAALHAAVLLVAAWQAPPPDVGGRATGADAATLRAMFGGDTPGPGHDEEDAQMGPPVHAEEVDPSPAKLEGIDPEPGAPAIDTVARGAPREPTTGAEPGGPAQPDGNPVDVPPPADPAHAPPRPAARRATRAGERVHAAAPGPGDALPSSDDPGVCLLDPGMHPMPGAYYRFTFAQGGTRSGVADEHGVVILRGLRAPLKVRVDWGREPSSFEYATDITVAAGRSHGDTPQSQREAAYGALGNLGFSERALADRIRMFQVRMGDRVTPRLEATGKLDRRTWELLWEVHDNSCQQ